VNRRREISRRAVLRGAGVALGLPWLESLVPREARGQTTPPRTFIAMSFPCGVTPLYWKPAATGTGDAWALSPILQPLAPVKSYVNVLQNVGNYGPFGGHVEPANANLTAALLTGTRPTVSADGSASCGISVDQVIAQTIGQMTPLDSLQVGLSTLASSTDGLPPECSRSISWRSPSEPLYKIINPMNAFDAIVNAGNLPADPVTAARRAKGKSVLDYVLGHAASVRAKVSASDRQHMDDFMSSVRQLELDTQGAPLPAGCGVLTRPSEAFLLGNVPADYDRDTHANLMIDLVVMAIQCGVTRVVSFMLDDARSDFVYDFLPMRTFSTTGSTPGSGTCVSPHGSMNAGANNDGYATINLWFVDKLSRLAQKLQASPSGAGTLLDDATIWFGSEMHGANRDALDLPILTVGKGGGRLKTNQSLDFATTARKSERLANLHLTFIRSVFDNVLITTFGKAVPPVATGPLSNDYGAGTDVIPEILA
jgi:hypothetical protein